ncbi:uncharacterized protein isoform X2 [Salmo salar]|uniref:Uncharacterized protein isoform X2 n=1 Tax=Salmo salar TaxID=8030 RepID=A0ABM3DBE9_SALSA|nr:uncharacterized protein LOC106576669 isoform X2 [Salmo salar]
MHFSSNAKQFVLLLIVGIFLLLGYVVFNHFNERQNMVWFDASKRDIPVDEDQRNTSLSKPIFRSRVQNIVSPESPVQSSLSSLWKHAVGLSGGMG